jgi:beta-xylosidase
MTGCSKLCYSSEKKQNADEICAAAPHVASVEIPSFADMIAQEVSLYPFTGTIEEVKNKVAFIAHSSGTTGKNI